MATIHGDAEAFLSTLAPDGELTFQTFEDAKIGRKGLSRVLHGTYRRNAARLDELNAKGAGCFVMVNRGDCRGRKVANVQTVRALFLDLDGAPLAPVEAAPIRPAIVCESSPGKYHAYWPIAGMPLSEFRPAQKALASSYGGDPKVCDLPRVMRLPGYLHTKGEPFQSRLLHCDPVKPWNWPDFAKAMELRCTTTGKSTGPYFEGERNESLYRFACGLRQQGLSLGEALRRMESANANRCIPPLDKAEVEGIVSSAWTGDSKGFVRLPYDLIDSPEFQRLSSDGKLVLIALMRRSNGQNNGRLTFTCEDAKKWNMDKRRRRNGLHAAEEAGLLTYTQRSMPGHSGHRAIPDLFRLLFLAE